MPIDVEQNEVGMLPSNRCGWALTEPNLSYHDREWGVPVHDDRLFFEMLTLEGAQAGLSWTTILKRRSGYRIAFDGFDPQVVASYGEIKKAQLMADGGIIRNRAKIEATVQNAGAFLELQRKWGSFDAFIWRYVDGSPIMGNWTDLSQVPASTPLSDVVSKDLKKLGFKFVGSTICYAFLQATGLVNDHLVSCFRHGQT